jgi:DNA-binding MarR family transcriptional regulator
MSAEQPLTQDEEAVVRTLPVAIRALLRRWDADLVASSGLSQVEYTVLRVLSESEHETCQLSRLAEECQQSLSAVSRTVGRLEAAGLVERRRSATDGRVADAVLTRPGRRRLKAAWPDHLRSVRRHFFDHMAGVDLAALAAALTAIANEDTPSAASQRRRSS